MAIYTNFATGPKCKQRANDALQVNQMLAGRRSRGAQYEYNKFTYS
jgi:hypothetical protein